MAQKLTDISIKALPIPSSGNKVFYDSAVKGFGCRVTAGGERSFILNYRTNSGRERRYTIGRVGEWKSTAAREEAAEIKRRIRSEGFDPLAALEAERTAPTMGELCDRFETDHLPKKRPATSRDYKDLIRRFIRPEMKVLKVEDVSIDDVEKLHRKITAANGPYIANRTIAVLSVMFKTAIRAKWRPDNPVKGIERNNEIRRQTYLNTEDVVRLTGALAKLEDEQAANIMRLLLLTGARRGEVLGARWEQFDLKAGSGTWTKPAASTKQKKDHRVPLSSAAQLLLTKLKAAAKPKAIYVFPGHGTEHRVEIRRAWRDVCKAAELTGVRIHDLRHTHASMLASAGISLPIIGALLGHTQPATTARYAHLLDDPQRQATERVGDIVTGKPSADVIPLKDRA